MWTMLAIGVERNQLEGAREKNYDSLDWDWVAVVAVTVLQAATC